MKRRDLIAQSTLMGLSLTLSQGTHAAPVLTPPQTEGPFYPVHKGTESDVDLTSLKAHKQRAQGEHVHIQMNIKDHLGNSIPNARVEIWQACASGKYNHPGDTFHAALDPHFQYQAVMQSDQNGAVRFRTVIPGSYPANASWDRPPHIHFKISIQDRVFLTSQLYFPGQPLNDIDRILLYCAKKYGVEAARSLIIDFTQNDGALPEGVVNIFLGLTPETE